MGNNDNRSVNINMNEFETKLIEYRSKEKHKERINRWKNAFWKSVSLFRNIHKENTTNRKKVERNCEHSLLPTIKEGSSSEWETDTASVVDSDTELDDTEESFCKINWYKFLLHVIVWSGTFAYAVHVEFGTVYLLLSGFYFMWINTRTAPRKESEVSAYSVFNPNCKRIQGTLDAETLEKEMKYGFII